MLDVTIQSRYLIVKCIAIGVFMNRALLIVVSFLFCTQAAMVEDLGTVAKYIFRQCHAKRD
jgi:hypothetical protein